MTDQLSANHEDQKNRLMVHLRPYEDLIIKGEEIIYGKHPLLLILFVVVFDALLIASYISGMGVFALISCVCLITYVIYFLNFRFGILKLVPQIDPVNKSEEKPLHSFEEICSDLASIKQKLGKLADYLLGNPFEQGVSKILYVLTVWFTLAFVFNIIGKFWPVFIITNILILTPGFNILFLVFGWVGTLTQHLYTIFVNSQQNQNVSPNVASTPEPAPVESEDTKVKTE